MAKSPDQASELVRCAEVVERELRRLEELSRSARNVTLSSEKNLARAARGLEQALEQQERLANELRGLGQAMQGMQARQEAAMTSLQKRALELQARMARHSEHMERFAALGSKAKEVVAALVDISNVGADAPGAQAASLLLDADQRIRDLVDEIRTMTEAAKADEFPEIAREAHSLEQRLTAARDRLSELARSKAIGAG
ncbi:MAG TPA: hypothetical protein VMG12_19925 [Polyangiaceae bacterium]|nr:hypothetical protein [Polyangiaceae bacterium]